MTQQSATLLGQYRPLDSYLHNLDARAKLIPVLAVMVLALFTTSFVFYLAMLAALIIGLLSSGVGFSTLLRTFKPVMLMVIITALYHLIFTERSSPPVFDVFGFPITEGGLYKSAYFSLRLLIFVSVAFLVTLTSSANELAEAFTRTLKPLQAIRIPVAELGLILFMAIRFVPVLTEEFVAIRNAQMIRGVRFDGSVFARLRKSTYLLIPVFISALSRADDLAMAMEARGYTDARTRSFYSHARFGGREIVFVLVSVVAIVGLFWGVA